MKQLIILSAILASVTVGSFGQTSLINVDMRTTTTTKSGPAAFGLTSGDVWNTAWAGTTLNLVYSDNSSSPVDIDVSLINTGVWGFTTTDPMFEQYIYPNPGNSPAGGDIDVAITSMPAGIYDIYIYAHGVDDRENGAVRLHAGGVTYGPKSTSTATGGAWNKTATLPWVEGNQYVVFRDIEVAASGTVSFTVSPSLLDNAPLNGFQIVRRDPRLINIDFGVGTTSSKTGPAAIGLNSSDFWNHYTRDDGSGGYRVNGSLLNMDLATGTDTDVDLYVYNAPGAWGSGHSDPMFSVYLYPASGNSFTVNVENLTPGIYDFYVYGHGNLNHYSGIYDLVTALDGMGPLSTTTGSGWTSSTWTEGQQYVVFRDVTISYLGDVASIYSTAAPSAVALINGMQILQTGYLPY